MALTQWLARSRRGGGDFTTQNISIPSGAGKFDGCNLKLDVAANDFSDPALSVYIAVEISPDGGQSWALQASVMWHGGPEPKDRAGNPVGWLASVSGISYFAGKTARVHLVTAGTFQWGLLGELI